MQTFRLAIILFTLSWATCALANDPIGVVIWDEQQPSQKKVYPRIPGTRTDIGILGKVR